MRKHGGFYENASWVRPHRLFETAQHTGALTGCDCGVGAAGRTFVAANARGLPLATAFRGFYGVLKCSPGAKSHAEIEALVRDEALPGGLRKQGGSCSGMPRVCRGGSGGRARDAAKKS